MGEVIEDVKKELLDKEFLNSQEVAVLLGVSRQRVWSLKKENKISPMFGTSNIQIYRTEDIRDYMKKSEQRTDAFYYENVSLTAAGNMLNEKNYILKKYLSENKIKHTKKGNGIYINKKELDEFARTVYGTDIENIMSGRQAGVYLGVKDEELLELIKKHDVKCKRSNGLKLTDRSFYKKDIEKIKAGR